jgi:putative transposase
MITGSPGHLRTFDYLGLHRYFLTFCTDRRRPVFTDSSRVELVQSQILRAAKDELFAVCAYCFMPDHLHLLVEAKSASSDGLRFIARSKQLSGFHYSKSFEERLWQRYGFERVLRDDEATLVVARYIVQNPVRAGLVENPEDYAFSGSEMFSMKEIVEAIQGMSGTSG